MAWWIVLLVILAIWTGALLYSSRRGRVRKDHRLFTNNSIYKATKLHPLLIESVQHITPESIIIRMMLPEADMRLGMEPGQYIKIHEPNPLPKRARRLGKQVSELMINGKPSLELGRSITRRYGIISPVQARGYCEIIVKLYLPNEEYPDGGLMSGILRDKGPGDTLTISGPYGRVRYMGEGHFLVDGHPIKATRLGMILGGSGVTPGFAIVQRIFENPNDQTEVSMIYGNRTYESIILRTRLEEYAQRFPHRFRLHLLVDEPLVTDSPDTPESPPESPFGLSKIARGPPNHVLHCSLSPAWSPTSASLKQVNRCHWEPLGRLTREVVMAHFPPASVDPLIFMIGPPGLLLECARPALRDLGYNLERVLPF
eukprot:Protomagalhaensia_sp_Gyna_25__6003@NODE_93_length_5325_cov_100_196557_g72_i0_p1_GENE_NODE_93_length_5325_cov_100_196557_g72_i0NODE_93_length_5325_cov_100_196557_g72_i0_p1_ORF_typecomplete_len371_score39_55FAD_binding_6/PF00970_24/3_2e14NAD_binding_1/PF00175_21/3_3e13NAD_binding_1/PF00175_21/1_8e03NAD_binding_6/PF08030_12/0_014_NODE_93_length_5325_cov_100_196557_g72_i0981210